MAILLLFLFIGEDVLIDLDGVEFAVRQIVVLFGFGAICVPFVFADTDRAIPVVVRHFLRHFAGYVIVLAGDSPFLAVGGVLDFLNTAPLVVIDLDAVQPSSFRFAVGVPLLNRQVFAFLAFCQLLRRQQTLR